MHAVGASLRDAAQVAGGDDDVVDVGVRSCLIQVAPSDFESVPVLKEGGSDHEAIVAAKRKSLKPFSVGRSSLVGKLCRPIVPFQLEKSHPT
jgi:hypothetical protein